MKCKVRLTQTVEMYVDGPSEDAIHEWLLCTTPQEAMDCAVNQVDVFYDEEIKKGGLKKRKKYTSSKSSIILLQEDEGESNEAESEMLKLQQQIMLNKQKRNSEDYFLNLAKKYGNEDEYNKYNDINEKEFKQIQKKLKKKKNK